MKSSRSLCIIGILLHLMSFSFCYKTPLRERSNMFKNSEESNVEISTEFAEVLVYDSYTKVRGDMRNSGGKTELKKIDVAKSESKVLVKEINSSHAMNAARNRTPNNPMTDKSESTNEFSADNETRRYIYDEHNKQYFPNQNKQFEIIDSYNKTGKHVHLNSANPINHYRYLQRRVYNEPPRRNETKSSEVSFNHENKESEGVDYNSGDEQVTIEDIIQQRKPNRYKFLNRMQSNKGVTNHKVNGQSFKIANESLRTQNHDKGKVIKDIVSQEPYFENSESSIISSKTRDGITTESIVRKVMGRNQTNQGVSYLRLQLKELKMKNQSQSHDARALPQNRERILKITDSQLQRFPINVRHSNKNWFSRDVADNASTSSVPDKKVYLKNFEDQTKSVTQFTIPAREKSARRRYTRPITYIPAGRRSPNTRKNKHQELTPLRKSTMSSNESYISSRKILPRTQYRLQISKVSKTSQKSRNAHEPLHTGTAKHNESLGVSFNEQRHSSVKTTKDYPVRNQYVKQKEPPTKDQRSVNIQSSKEIQLSISKENVQLTDQFLKFMEQPGAMNENSEVLSQFYTDVLEKSERENKTNNHLNVNLGERKGAIMSNTDQYSRNISDQISSDIPKTYGKLGHNTYIVEDYTDGEVESHIKQLNAKFSSKKEVESTQRKIPVFHIHPVNFTNGNEQARYNKKTKFLNVPTFYFKQFLRYSPASRATNITLIDTILPSTEYFSVNATHEDENKSARIPNAESSSLHDVIQIGRSTTQRTEFTDQIVHEELITSTEKYNNLTVDYSSSESLIEITTSNSILQNNTPHETIDKFNGTSNLLPTDQYSNSLLYSNYSSTEIIETTVLPDTSKSIHLLTTVSELPKGEKIGNYTDIIGYLNVSTENPNRLIAQFKHIFDFSTTLPKLNESLLDADRLPSLLSKIPVSPARMNTQFSNPFLQQVSHKLTPFIKSNIGLKFDDFALPTIPDFSHAPTSKPPTTLPDVSFSLPPSIIHPAAVQTKSNSNDIGGLGLFGLLGGNQPNMAQIGSPTNQLPGQNFLVPTLTGLTPHQQQFDTSLIHLYLSQFSNPGPLLHSPLSLYGNNPTALTSTRKITH